MKYRIFWFTAFSVLFGNSLAFADLSFVSNSIRFQPADALVGKSTTIYLSIHNSSGEDLRGVVKIYDEKEQKRVGSDQSFSVIAGQDDSIFLEFTPSVPGDHVLAFKIIPWDAAKDAPENNKVTKTLFVDEDTDQDGQGNRTDEDDDNDGTLDEEDEFPLDAKEWSDTDQDGKGNNADEDDDNDKIPDVEDAFPLDENETEDADQDGVGDTADTDDDGDGLDDEAEPKKGTDPEKFDTDGDGVGDGADDYPLDRSKTLDTDKDGIPNEDDDDDDADGVKDSRDALPIDNSETEDADGDGKGDNADPDDDNDRVPDQEEKERGMNPFDSDTDGDGFLDAKDEVPLDPEEHQDSDDDELGDNLDPDSSNPGPIVRVKTSTDTVQKGGRVTFDASSSYDPDGGGLQFEWRLPNGEVRKGSRMEYVFDRSGKRKVELYVVDNEGEPRTRIIPITVQGGASEKFLWIFLVLLIGGSIFAARKPRKKILEEPAPSTDSISPATGEEISSKK